MLSLTPPSTASAVAALAQPGGFAWWYLDLVDGAGNGLVLIWSFGLPFLPGVRAAPEAATRRPALVVSVYAGAREAFYVFREFPPEQVSWDPATGSGRFGDTSVRLHLDAARVELDIALDLAVPGCTRPLTGRVTVAGAARRGPGWGAATAHQWMPLTSATTGRVRLHGAFETALEGRAYLDHNCATVPMTDQGIRRWSWGRIALPTRELIWYGLVPDGGGPTEGLVLEVAADGASRVAALNLAGSRSRRSWSGIARPTRLHFADPDGVPVEVAVGPPVDDAPFYQRSLVEAVCGGERGAGVSEIVLPRLLDQPWLRPFVSMRVARPDGADSFLLPALSGPRVGRWSRLWSPPPLALPEPRG